MLKLPYVKIVGIVTKKTSPFNHDFCDLRRIAIDNHIPCHYFDSSSSVGELNSWIRERHADVIYCFGWSLILKQETLAIPRLGAVGSHPAPLPKNRGRHPIIWTLVLGLKKTASTFFFMDKGTDSGDIISQVFVEVLDTDTAQTLYTKLTHVALKQIESISEGLLRGDILRISQKKEAANYWRKRTERDGLIDWRMSSQAIYNLVRALTHPYVGAHCLYKEREVKVWKAHVLNLRGKWNNIEHGKVLTVEGNRLHIKCGDQAIQLIEHEFDPMPTKGEYL